MMKFIGEMEPVIQDYIEKNLGISHIAPFMT